MSENVSLEYEGPLRIEFEEGVYGLLELGDDDLADNLAEKLHDLVGAPTGDDGWRQGAVISNVRLTIEVIEPDPAEMT